MSRTNRSSLEKEIAKRINNAKSKTQKPEYLRQLVANMYLEIESALARGCDFDDLAASISVDGIEITANKLKRFHRENQKQKQKQKQFEAINQEHQLQGEQKTIEFFGEEPKDVVERPGILSGEATSSTSNKEDLSSPFKQW
ncbi:MAG: hypothetical protein ACRC1Z_15810 [Waterburya sp.]